MPAKIDPAAAARHFRKADPVIHGVFKQVGPCTLKPQRDRFGMLVRSIISQQISTSAARSIRAKLEALIAPEKVRPEVLSASHLRTTPQRGALQSEGDLPARPGGQSGGRDGAAEDGRPARTTRKSSKS